MWVVCVYVQKMELCFWWQYGDEKSGINQFNEKCSLILWGLRVLIWEINFPSGKAANCHIMLRMVREIKVSSNWFGCILVISFYVTKVFSESVTKLSSCFTNVKLFAINTSYTVNDTGRGASEMNSDLDGPLRFRHFLQIVNESIH